MKYKNRSAVFIVAMLLLTALTLPAFAGNCSNPTQPEGYVMYNMDQHILQFCNGTNWISAGGGNTNSCPYMSGVCPASNSSGVGCISGQTLGWGTVTCTTTSGVQKVTFNSPTYASGIPGGADAGEANETAMKFCGDLGMASDTSTSTVSAGQWYDAKATTTTDGTLWRTRGTTSSNKLTSIVCQDILAIP